MKKSILIISLLMLTGCGLLDQAKKDAEFTYNKTKTKIEDTQEVIETKYNEGLEKLNETKENVQNKIEQVQTSVNELVEETNKTVEEVENAVTQVQEAKEAINNLTQ